MNRNTTNSFNTSSQRPMFRTEKMVKSRDDKDKLFRLFLLIASFCLSLFLSSLPLCLSSHFLSCTFSLSLSLSPGSE